MMLVSAGHLAFNLLFWSGCREGELLALSPSDFIQSDGNYFLNIDKNYEVVKRVEYILTPKTPSSIRKVSLPEFLYWEAMDYIKKLYDIRPALIDISQEEIFCWNPNAKDKRLVSKEEFENAAELAEDIEAALAVAEIYQEGFLEICGLVYCLASRGGIPIRYL